jgi:hypothetical protein
MLADVRWRAAGNSITKAIVLPLALTIVRQLGEEVIKRFDVYTHRFLVFIEEAEVLASIG